MNRVIHFEIPADNIERARKFYQKVFGWKINIVSDMDYTLFQTGPTDEKGMTQEKGFINGGMMKRQEDIKSPVITIEMPDIEEAAKKITEQGGKVIRPKMDVGDMGYAAYFKDSEGNVMGIWQNKR